MTDNDSIDLQIHRRIEDMIRIFSAHRGLSRAQVIEDLACGDKKFDHGVTAIGEMFNLPIDEVNERITAFIEAEREEEAERIARLIAGVVSQEDAE